MPTADPKTIEMTQLTFEFLRRVVNELKGRKFEYIKEPGGRPPHAEMITAQGKADDLLYVLPEITREFAGKIKPEFSRCYELRAPGPLPSWTARDPISGISIRCVRIWDVTENDMRCRFDAVFS